MINCYIPQNLEQFLTTYLIMQNLVIPFNIFPSFIPNPLSIFSGFLSASFVANFKLRGIQSLSFLYNFADQLFTWLVLGIIYIVLKILTKCIPEKK